MCMIVILLNGHFKIVWINSSSISYSLDVCTQYLRIKDVALGHNYCTYYTVSVHNNAQGLIIAHVLQT